jgi:hypothetical protein
MYKLVDLSDYISQSNDAYVASHDGDQKQFGAYEEAYKWLLHKFIFLGLNLLQPIK